jgi:uncharacterized protein YegL
MKAHPPIQTELLFILDRSGSMESMRQAAIDGFNQFLRDQQAAPDSARLTLLQFDDQLETPIDALPLPEVTTLTPDTFVPRGSTALLDAVGHGIDTLGKRLAALPADQRPRNVIVAILTDGHENSSTRYTWKDVSARIAHQRDKYDWDFFFLGAGPDAIASAGRMRIGRRFSSGYTADDAGMGASYSAVSEKILSRRAIKQGYATEKDHAEDARSLEDSVKEKDQQRRPDRNQ